MQKKIRNEILKPFEAELNELVRDVLERLMREEREIYVEQHLTKANGYYTRDLLTLVGPLEDLKVPRVREGNFHPRILPTELRRGQSGGFRSARREFGSAQAPRIGGNPDRKPAC